MTDLRCTKCGIERTFADANIADLHRTCGSSLEPGNVTDYGTAIGGEEHDWEEL
jgi:hypothetical protein